MAMHGGGRVGVVLAGWKTWLFCLDTTTDRLGVPGVV
jgi:hypothetical protein